MSVQPLVISFPVFDNEIHSGLRSQGCAGRVIGLKVQPIKHVHPDKAPLNGQVTGIDEKGRLWRFTMLLSDWYDAVKNPVWFVEGSDIRGPQAAYQESNRVTD